MNVCLVGTAELWKLGQVHDLEGAVDDDLANADNLSDLVDDALESGGWPDNESVEVEKVDVSADVLTAYVTIYFTEMIPSSCKDMPNEEDRLARLVLTLQPGETEASVSYSSSDPSQWGLLDRNSAADGT